MRQRMRGKTGRRTDDFTVSYEGLNLNNPPPGGEKLVSGSNIEQPPKCWLTLLGVLAFGGAHDLVGWSLGKGALSCQ